MRKKKIRMAFTAEYLAMVSGVDITKATVGGISVDFSRNMIYVNFISDDYTVPSWHEESGDLYLFDCPEGQETPEVIPQFTERHPLAVLKRQWDEYRAK